MRVSLVTDAWSPQVNGVVTTLQRTIDALRELQIDVDVITPEGHRTLPCPSYPEIRLVWGGAGEVRRRLEAFQPDAVHIATEGPLGWAARGHCLERGWRFTTSYHTRFPEYLRARWPVPESLSYAWLRRFHGAAVVGVTPASCRILRQAWRLRTASPPRRHLLRQRIPLKRMVGKRRRFRDGAR